MTKEEIKELIRYEYENGSSISVLADKYSQKTGTIKSWISREGWSKKKENTATSKRATKKDNKKKQLKKATKKKIKKVVADEKDIKIAVDVLEGKSKEEIMQKYAIAERTYYKKSENARKIRLERTERYLDRIIEKIYPNLEGILEKSEMIKQNIIARIINGNNLKSENLLEIKELEELEKRYNIIKKLGNDLLKTGKMLTSYELLEIDKQLSDEELILQKLEIEKSKNKINNEDTKIEIELIEV